MCFACLTQRLADASRKEDEKCHKLICLRFHYLINIAKWQRMCDISSAKVVQTIMLIAVLRLHGRAILQATRNQCVSGAT